MLLRRVAPVGDPFESFAVSGKNFNAQFFQLNDGQRRQVGRCAEGFGRFYEVQIAAYGLLDKEIGGGSYRLSQ
jgi:hypothetical protein